MRRLQLPLGLSRFLSTAALTLGVLTFAAGAWLIFLEQRIGTGLLLCLAGAVLAIPLLVAVEGTRLPRDDEEPEEWLPE